MEEGFGLAVGQFIRGPFPRECETEVAWNKPARHTAEVFPEHRKQTIKD
jgi:hypothetical protein